MTRRHIRDDERFSIVHSMEFCFVCLRKPVTIHEIFEGTANRQKSKDFGLCIALCPECHDRAHKDKELKRYLHKVGQMAFENHYPSESFVEIFGKNYK